MTDPTADMALLQRFEPVIRFTAGELFYPTAVEPYVARATLWEHDQDAAITCIVPAGELKMDRLIEESMTRPGAELSLRFVDEALGRRALRAWRKRPERPSFSARGRFTQVGLMSRVIDALFRLGLLLRGRVPGGLAAAAEQSYRAHLDPHHHPYYGRVVRDGGYVALQYWYFYAMNDWRSSFGGANDHEADWEQVTIYLSADPSGGLRPSWVAFSTHDVVGDDLRRRWDDPDLVLQGDHPVVFAGAGSHSGAYIAGEYVTAVKAPGALGRVFEVARSIARVVTPWSRGEIASGLGIPFIDYSRGDGEAIGPAHSRTWSPVLIDDTTPWVQQFRGLWGLDTRDRFGGERAPAGPRYERGGAVRGRTRSVGAACRRSPRRTPNQSTCCAAGSTRSTPHSAGSTTTSRPGRPSCGGWRQPRRRSTVARGWRRRSPPDRPRSANASAACSTRRPRARRSPMSGPPTCRRWPARRRRGHPRPISATSTCRSGVRRTSGTGSCVCGPR